MSDQVVGVAPRTASPVRYWYVVAAVLALVMMVLAIQYGSDWLLNFLHVMTGALWTGIDLFMGFVVGPVLKRLPLEARRAVISGLVPRTLFLMPTASPRPPVGSSPNEWVFSMSATRSSVGSSRPSSS